VEDEVREEARRDGPCFPAIFNVLASAVSNAAEQEKVFVELSSPEQSSKKWSHSFADNTFGKYEIRYKYS
jgi:hypothetical protein